jgi:hypothetical protein
VKAFVLAFALLFGLSAFAQDSEKKPKPRKPATGAPKAAHQQPSKDQVRKFNELQKKQQPQKSAK